MQADGELLEAWRAGDEAAGAELFERHFAAVARFFKNKVNRDLDDLIQRTFLGCVEARERFEGRSSFRTYLFAIAHNVLREHFRERHRGAVVDFETSAVADLAPGASTMVARKREHRLLVEALRRIPFDLQVALELFYFEQLGSPAIAEILEVPEGTVRSRIRRGRERLQATIAELMAEIATEPTEHDGDALDRWVEDMRVQVFGMGE